MKDKLFFTKLISFDDGGDYGIDYFVREDYSIYTIEYISYNKQTMVI